ncbi:MAG: single-stranded DNA-binding protein [Butyrivibrio sp.]|nr:single-stranded DNA-binding protein [Butyrivibrio sp.]
MNKAILVGRLTRDPDIRYSQGDQPLCIARYTLAVDRRFRRNNGGGDEQTADFISCVAFGRTGEFAEKYLHKGTKMIVEGRIQTGSYTNKEGQKVYTTEVVVENQEFAESKAASSGGGSYQSAPAQSSDNGGAQAPAEGFMNIPDGIEGDLPF